MPVFFNDGIAPPGSGRLPQQLFVAAATAAFAMMLVFRATPTAMIQHLRIVAASLLLSLAGGLAGAANVASDSDIGKAMNPFSPEVQKSLNEKAPGASANPAGGGMPAQAELSPRCQRLRAEIDSARYSEPPPQHDTYPRERRRDGGYIAPPQPAFNGSVSINSSNSVPGGIRYDRRARLEDQFQRECR